MHLEKPYYSGTSKDFEDTLKYSALTGSRPHIETFSLDQVNEAYKHMIKGQASRAALKID
jgi:alcohol dehydrogenase, propanol-preferring